MIINSEYKNSLILLAKRVNPEYNKWREAFEHKGRKFWRCLICNKITPLYSQESINHGEFHLKEKGLLPFI